jgi:hypothetical protein
MSENKTVFETAIETLLSKVDTTEKFVVDQAPEVCRQLIAEKKVTETMDATFHTFLFPVLIYATHALAVAAQGDYERYSDKPLLFWLLATFCGVAAFFSFLILYGAVQSLLTLKVAPKAFLLREFKSMVSKKDEE